MAQIVHAKIQKWGNGLGLRVAGLMRDIPHFSLNTDVEVEARLIGQACEGIMDEILLRIVPLIGANSLIEAIINNEIRNH